MVRLCRRPGAMLVERGQTKLAWGVRLGSLVSSPQTAADEQHVAGTTEDVHSVVKQLWRMPFARQRAAATCSAA